MGILNERGRQFRSVGGRLPMGAKNNFDNLASLESEVVGTILGMRWGVLFGVNIEQSTF